MCGNVTTITRLLNKTSVERVWSCNTPHESSADGPSITHYYFVFINEVLFVRSYYCPHDRDLSATKVHRDGSICYSTLLDVSPSLDQTSENVEQFSTTVLAHQRRWKTEMQLNDSDDGIQLRITLRPEPL
jgi:hypothetical protein